MNIYDLTEQYLHVKNIAKMMNDDILESIIIDLSDNHSIILSVDINTDELILKIDQFIGKSQNLISILPNFHDLILIRGWMMSNHLGYYDAIQLEFFDKQNSVSKYIQFMVTSSEIEIYDF